MDTEIQISAVISPSTKELLDRYVEEQGIKKAYLIEAALLHHLQALRELPADVIIPPRLVVTAESGQRVLDSLAHPPKPTTAMNALFADPASFPDEKF